jgi:hypothetical protein
MVGVCDMKKNSKKLFAIGVTVYASVFTSGCERISEKEKLEIRVRCDEVARKKFQTEDYFERGEGGVFTTVETNYSFGDGRCYASVYRRLTLVTAKGLEETVTHELNDGISGQTLISVMEYGTKKTLISGPLVSITATKDQALSLIEIHMKKP